MSGPTTGPAEIELPPVQPGNVDSLTAERVFLSPYIRYLEASKVAGRTLEEKRSAKELTPTKRNIEAKAGETNLQT